MGLNIIGTAGLETVTATTWKGVRKESKQRGDPPEPIFSRCYEDRMGAL
jgi:hypothetical protein